MMSGLRPPWLVSSIYLLCTREGKCQVAQTFDHGQYHLHGDVAWQWPTRFVGRFNPTMVS
jgi:hypothetical protein